MMMLFMAYYCDDGSCRVRDGGVPSVLVWDAKALRLALKRLESGIERHQRHSFKQIIDCCYLDPNSKWTNKIEMRCND
jgi:hypothetical protein